MSKSLGNSPDPIDIIGRAGADAFRFTLMMLSPPGQDIMFDESKVDVGKHFANKIWNAARFVLAQEVGAGCADDGAPGAAAVPAPDACSPAWLSRVDLRRRGGPGYRIRMGGPLDREPPRSPGRGARRAYRHLSLRRSVAHALRFLLARVLRLVSRALEGGGTAGRSAGAGRGGHGARRSRGVDGAPPSDDAVHHGGDLEHAGAAARGAGGVSIPRGFRSGASTKRSRRTRHSFMEIVTAIRNLRQSFNIPPGKLVSIVINSEKGRGDSRAPRSVPRADRAPGEG